jgi:hypothetical protein
MDLTQIFMTALGLACTVLGWFARELYAATQALRKDLSSLEAMILRDYVRYDRLRDAMHDATKPIMDSLAEIKHTLQGKADK